MFVNKVGFVPNIGFKSLNYGKNSVGEDILRFNFPYNPQEETCEVQIFKVTPTDNYNYRLSDNPIATIPLKPEGIKVNLQDITNLDKNEPFAYNYVRKDKEGNILSENADTGMKIKRSENGEYVFKVSNEEPSSKYTHTFVTRKSTTPTVNGAGYLAIPDSFVPGARYRGFNDSNTGEIYYDKNIQKSAEESIRTFSNIYGGGIAGLEAKIPYLKENGYKMLFSTPIANGDDVSSHSYWNKNNMQIASRMGTIENFSSFMREMYKNGMGYVYDGTFTSEGLEGIHFQYALRWAQNNPQTYYWFRMDGIKNQSIGLGVIPENAKNLRHRVINSPYNYELQSGGIYKKVTNPNYKPNKETIFQIYDASQVSESSVSDLDNIIRVYDNIKSDKKELDINTHNDTLIGYAFQIDPKEYDDRINTINQLNKNGHKIKLDTTEGTALAGQFSNFKIDKKTEGGFVAWDANTDMVKMNYGISGYDLKALQAIPDSAQRYLEQQKIERATKEVQDMAIQAGKYWTQKVKDIQTIYTAQTIGKTKTISGIEKLIQEGKLPKEAIINEEILANVINGEYLLSPKGISDKDSVTVKALMQLPLDALEFGENTVGVLSTSYFSNRATTDETIGMSRYELLKSGNPHLVKDYANVYNKVNGLFTNELKKFADDIINQVNKNSNEKLLNSDGSYTEYGEYIIELAGQDIAKYALMKSLAGSTFKVKVLANGELTYDYDSIKSATTLKSLGINGYSPEDEAQKLEHKIAKGLKTISSSDINFVADAINKRIAGTDISSFRLAEAIVNRAGLGLNWRLDAAKDVMDMDAIRNRDESFDDVWDKVIKFWAMYVQAVKSQNPNSYIVAEITDIPDLIRDTYGEKSCPYNGETNIGQKFNGAPDALAKFFNETGINSEAGYSYFFTDLLKVFAPEFETGTGISNEHDSFKGRFDELINTRSADYIRNLYTFIGNHDKPRMIHGLALDMRLYHSKMLNDYVNFSENRNHRTDAIRVLSGSKTIDEIPIELRLNVDNNDYFKTVSPRAVAMSKLLMDVVNEDIGSIATNADKNILINALRDLANGNYLGDSTSLSRISIPELQNMDNACAEIFKLAEAHGLRLIESEKQRLITEIKKQVNSSDISDYLVHGDFDWADNGVGEKNRKYLNDFIGETLNAQEYDVYTLQLARLISDSYAKTQNPKYTDMIKAASVDFVKKYNREKISSAKDYTMSEPLVTTMKKNGYAARDIHTAIEMAIKHAEVKYGRAIQNKEQVVESIYKYATEPAVAKASMIMEFMKGLPGIYTMYAGDEFGMTGWEEKAKNVYLQNRNALPWESLTDYRKRIAESMNGAMQNRPQALNTGTPYDMGVVVNNRNRIQIWERIHEIDELLKSNPSDKTSLMREKAELKQSLAKVAYMMYSADGNAAISIFDAGAIDFGNRYDYFKKYGIRSQAELQDFLRKNNAQTINPENRYVPLIPKSEIDAIILAGGIALPVGTVFVNSNARDKARYVVQQAKDGLKIVKEGGGKIIMDCFTSKNGVMILKRLGFRGSKRPLFNKQFNIFSNPYKISESVEEGKNLSILFR